MASERRSALRNIRPSSGCHSRSIEIVMAPLKAEPDCCAARYAGIDNRIVSLGEVLHRSVYRPGLTWIYLLPILFGRVTAACGNRRRGVADHAGIPNE